MSSAIIAIAALTAAASAAPAAALPSQQSAEILMTGLFHGDEVDPSVSGHTWMGLYADGEGYTLERTRVRVQPVYDPVVDMPGESSGWLVTAEGEDEPLFLVRGLAGLAEGPVHTAMSGPEAVDVGDSRSLADGPDGWYALAAFGSARPSPDLYGLPEVSDYELRLYRHPPLGFDAAPEAPSSQPLVQLETLMDARPQVLWAGDLDRDGQLDLLLDASFHYNVSDYALWTSRGAPAGELVRRVAGLTTSGC